MLAQSSTFFVPLPRVRAAVPSSPSRHAAAQRRYAARLKDQGIPRSADVGRAFLKAARGCLAERPVGGDPEAWKRLYATALAILEVRGTSLETAKHRLDRMLGLNAPEP